ncbi:hypothetical protein [Tsukamurella hominis]|uniref:hypothetical protein n=1 Tax=Tsukamurella hominis TaxID=1970232 RepID=UPI0039EC4856
MTDGDDFATLVRATGPLPADRVARAVAEAAAEVDRLLTEGHPHGRISPAAIIAQADGRIVLAAPASLGDSPDTGAHAAPEIFAGSPPDARSEVFSLASTAYTLLTGTAPNSFGIANARRARPDLGPGLEAALTRATSRDPAFRFQSAGDFARALAAALAPAPDAAPQDSAAPSAHAGGRPRKISAATALALVALTLAVVSALLWGAIFVVQNLS